MTAEQLEELLVKVTPDYWQYSSAEGSRVWMSPEQNRRSTYARIGMIERNLYSEDTIAAIARRVLSAEKLVEALEAMRGRTILYCGGDGLPFAGHTDVKLLGLADAALTAYREASK